MKRAGAVHPPFLVLLVAVARVAAAVRVGAVVPVIVITPGRRSLVRLPRVVVAILLADEGDVAVGRPADRDIGPDAAALSFSFDIQVDEHGVEDLLDCSE